MFRKNPLSYERETTRRRIWHIVWTGAFPCSQSDFQNARNRHPCNSKLKGQQFQMEKQFIS
ncbi:unnamed protein product [Nesidiocoris tenuis]|uniref:Uncharacterized protein n=1 Tax=Nesidiocoris tenuis TaxID=355587 RepID=A0A6H5HMC3_9HEMI|nr:unnamed protein product [Nesidiocoris tenuis]